MTEEVGQASWDGWLRAGERVSKGEGEQGSKGEMQNAQ